jgi:peptide-methionine (R)-S-oxide reductase
MDWQRRDFLKAAAAVAVAPLVLAYPLSRRNDEEEEPVIGSGPTDQEIERLRKPRSEWRKILEADEYAVLFDDDTERAGSSPLNAEKRPGTYVCAACFLPLFSSEAKYESGTGWPSFYEPLRGRVGTKRDFKLILPRTEYHCIRCGGHQGHVFKDGPPPTGQRWCNNGVALEFVPEGEPLPALRT